MTFNINRPALHLKGMTVGTGWNVEDLIKDDSIKGFSISYIVEKDGVKAILKALDFSIALLNDDPINALRKLTETYDFEKELLELCSDNKLKNVIKILEHGVIKPTQGSILPVPFFILEYAIENLSEQITFDSYLNIAWLLKILHNVSLGLFQLHKLNISHTNLKPETVQSFSKDLYKLSELGRSELKGIVTPHKDYFETEDPAYMTPEALYGYIEPDWLHRHQATDLYHLGSLIFFLLTQTNMNSMLYMYLDKSHNWNNWGGTYEEALPYLLNAFDMILIQFNVYVEDPKIQSRLEPLLRSLCHPDPKQRGHIRILGKDKFGVLAMEKYISDFDLLYKTALYNLTK